MPEVRQANGSRTQVLNGNRVLDYHNRFDRLDMATWLCIQNRISYDFRRQLCDQPSLDAMNGFALGVKFWDDKDRRRVGLWVDEDKPIHA